MRLLLVLILSTQFSYGAARDTKDNGDFGKGGAHAPSEEPAVSGISAIANAPLAPEYKTEKFLILVNTICSQATVASRDNNHAIGRLMEGQFLRYLGISKTTLNYK